MATRKYLHLLALFTIGTVIVYFIPHKYNWDLVAYISIAASFSGTPDTENHQQTYNKLRESIPAEDYLRLTSGSYRSSSANDAESFRQQIPFYSVKPLYPGMIALLEIVGFSLPMSLLIIKFLAIEFILLFSFKIVATHLPGIHATALAAFSVFFPPLLLTAELFTPDLISVALILAFGYEYLIRRRTLWLTIIALLLVLGRPDNILFCASYLAYELIFSRNPRSAIVFGFCFTSYLAQASLSGNYGWMTLFRHSFIGFMAYPAEQSQPLSLGEIINVYVNSLTHTDFAFMVVFIALGATIFWITRTSTEDGTRALGALTAMHAVNSGIHWAAFPSELYRINLSSTYPIILIALVLVMPPILTTTVRINTVRYQLLAVLLGIIAIALAGGRTLMFGLQSTRFSELTWYSIVGFVCLFALRNTTRTKSR